MTRRQWAGRLATMAAGFPALSETAFAQRGRALPGAPPGTAWLNANENPEGPPPAVLDAMRAALALTNRYNYQQFAEIYETIARSEGLAAPQILVGAGSSEILHCAVAAFTSRERPMVSIDPTYELPGGVAAALGIPVRKVPLTASFSVDVKRLAEEARSSRAGLIYACNPNNPTANIIPAADVAWLVANLPADTILLLDEAYIHFAREMDSLSALQYVKQGKNVIVSRTFSKIYGMAGLRIGFGCARPDLIEKMEPFRDNVVSIVGARAAVAAIGARDSMLPDRRMRIMGVRDELCAWLRKKGLKFIDPHANFLMIETGRDALAMQKALLAEAVAVGRPFPPYEKRMMRVSIGTAEEMEKFRRAFAKVMAL